VRGLRAEVEPGRHLDGHRAASGGNDEHHQRGIRSRTHAGSVPPADLVAADAEHVDERRHRRQLDAASPVAGGPDQAEVLAHRVRQRLLRFHDAARHRVGHCGLPIPIRARQREADLEPRRRQHARLEHQVVVHLDQVAVLACETIRTRPDSVYLPALQEQGAHAHPGRSPIDTPRNIGRQYQAYLGRRPTLRTEHHHHHHPEVVLRRRRSAVNAHPVASGERNGNPLTRRT